MLKQPQGLGAGADDGRLAQAEGLQQTITDREAEIVKIIKESLTKEQRLELGLMLLRQNLVSLTAVEAVDFQWSAAVLELNMNKPQRELAGGALQAITDAVKSRKEDHEDLLECSERCLRSADTEHRESEENLNHLIQELEAACSAALAEDYELMNKLKAVLTPQQQMCFLAWILGVKGPADFHRVWSPRVAALHRSPLGRYLPSFEVLTAKQVDAISTLLQSHSSTFAEAVRDLTTAAQAVCAAQGDAIPDAVAALFAKRDAVTAVDRAGLEALCQHFKLAQRGEVAAVRARLLLPSSSENDAAFPWWNAAVSEAALSDEQVAAIDAKLAELRALQDSLQPKLEPVEAGLPNGAGLQQAISELQVAEVTFSTQRDKLEKQIVLLLEPAQQKIILQAALAPVSS